jgi:hypothetical protein
VTQSYFLFSPRVHEQLRSSFCLKWNYTSWVWLRSFSWHMQFSGERSSRKSKEKDRIRFKKQFWSHVRGEFTQLPGVYRLLLEAAIRNLAWLHRQSPPRAGSRKHTFSERKMSENLVTGWCVFNHRKFGFSLSRKGLGSGVSLQQRVHMGRLKPYKKKRYPSRDAYDPPTISEFPSSCIRCCSRWRWGILSGGRRRHALVTQACS